MYKLTLSCAQHVHYLCICLRVFINRGSTATQNEGHFIPGPPRQKKKKEEVVCCHGNGKSLHGEKSVGAANQPQCGKGSGEEGGRGVSKDGVN